MSIDSSLKSVIETNFTNNSVKKELIKKLDDNKLTGTEISLIEKEIEKAEPKNAPAIIKEFEDTLKNKLDINVDSVKDSNFNASSFQFNVENKKFAKEKTPDTKNSDSFQSLKDILGESSFVDKTPEKIDNIGEKIAPVITNHKNDVENLEIKKFTNLKKEDFDTFKRAFPDMKTVPPVLDQKASNDFSQKVFGMSSQDLQKLVGDSDSSGKFSAKTMFLIKEHLAKMANGPQNLEDCEKVAAQIEKFKGETNGINHDTRFLEIEKTVSLKSTNILHDEIYKETSLTGLEKIGKKVDSLKDSPEKDRLKSALSDRITDILKNKIAQANLADIENITNYISSKGDISPSDKKLLTGNISSIANKMLAERFDKISNSTDCLSFKYAIDKLAGSVGADSVNQFREQLGRKSVVMLDKEIKGLKDPKPSQCNDISYNLNHLKDIIPKGSFDPLKNSIAVKDRIANIYGEQGLDFKDVRQGGIGDCYFMAALSSMAKQRPEQLKNMISYNSDCSIIFVKFPDQKEPIGVKYPTKDELDKYARDGKDGDVWTCAVEKAYSYVTAFRDHEGNKDAPRKNISDGGSLATGISVLTGHDTDSDILMVTRDSTTKDKITSALKNNKLVTLASAGKSDTHIVDGIAQNHAYSVIGYDPKTDKITIRNPWGDGLGEEFKGKGKDGIFEISFADLNKYFTSIDYEE